MHEPFKAFKFRKIKIGLAGITAVRKNPATISIISAVNCRYLIIGGLMHHMKML